MFSAFRKGKYDRADVLMSAGVSTFVCASLVLITPRLGIVFIEILMGLFLIGCAFVSRRRLSRTCCDIETDSGPGEKNNLRTRFCDRYDLSIVLAVALFQITLAGSLQKAGWSEGSVRILPLVLFGIGILLKPRLLEWVRKWKRVRALRTHAMTRMAGRPSFEEPIDEKIYRP
ncbi:MAG: hypothetical protein M3Y27_01240 [Acidobacteriota bacterium]|nr:hypothetical protein [Acidobacteriota bacterium]